MVKLGCKMNGCSQVEFMHNKIVQINSHLSPALNNPIFYMLALKNLSLKSRSKKGFMNVTTILLDSMLYVSRYLVS